MSSETTCCPRLSKAGRVPSLLLLPTATYRLWVLELRQLRSSLPILPSPTLAYLLEAGIARILFRKVVSTLKHWAHTQEIKPY